MWSLFPQFLVLFSWQWFSLPEITGVLVYFLSIAHPLPRKRNHCLCSGLFCHCLGQCSAHNNCSANIYWTNERNEYTGKAQNRDSITTSVFFFKNMGLPLHVLSPCITWKWARPQVMEFSRVLPVQAKRTFSGFFNFFRRRLSELLSSEWPGEEFSFRFKSICW